ncbi:hypothetical protein [Paraferrimonas sedimenticola]|uniref:Uncharacterized protein n=1 Tax=Paraferrimonas sedimenticola TaxID=375674 RepID=A0AA37RTW3_9GAMM|nr:hypothetical protein [Paraferrimonas sedimenticola]GLP95645.1 hypothetical protein GCM10007895_09510 [Paraferrimonas sedimenticola]
MFHQLVVSGGCKRVTPPWSLAVIMTVLFCTSVQAGSVVVRNTNQDYDAFAVRDEKKRQYQRQEAIRLQQSLRIVRAVPLGCVIYPNHQLPWLCSPYYPLPTQAWGTALSDNNSRGQR